MDKQMYVQVVNLETGKIFSLPTLYARFTEACIHGQNYVRDRQAEDRCSLLFFRVAESYDGKVADSFNIYDENKDEESEHDESVYRNTEEPNKEVMDEILSMLQTHAVRL